MTWKTPPSTSGDGWTERPEDNDDNDDDDDDDDDHNKSWRIAKTDERTISEKPDASVFYFVSNFIIFFAAVVVLAVVVVDDVEINFDSNIFLLRRNRS